MIAASHDIKFDCCHCGQRIVVERAGAGRQAPCPVCENVVTVPHHFGGEPRSEVERHRRRRGAPAEPAGHPGKEESARQEIARLHASWKRAADECERMTASATHAQAEIKSFHSDRQQLKADLSQARHRTAAAGTQVAELTARLARVDEENAGLREQLDFAGVSLERLAAMETQLGVRERELARRHAENVEVLQALAATQAELAALSAQTARLRAEFETAQQLLNDAAQLEQQFAAEAAGLRAQVASAGAENHALLEARDQWQAQAGALRRDLTVSDSGRELLELRGRAQELIDEKTRLAEALATATGEARARLAAHRTLQEELLETRRLRAEAEGRATQNSEAQLLKDNDVLRGIVARQNTTLGVHYVEVRRLRRARIALRILYLSFALGLLGLVAFALAVFSSHGIGDFFGDLHF